MTKNNKVAVLTTAQGLPLVIRSNPTQAEVKSFIKEHNRRYQVGEPGGPAGSDAVEIVSAHFYPSEEDIGQEALATPIKLPKTILVQEK
jgi:hypothetical protein